MFGVTVGSLLIFRNLLSQNLLDSPANFLNPAFSHGGILMTRNRGYFYMVIAALLWSTAGVFLKMIDWHPLVTSSFRSAIAAMILWAFLRKEKLYYLQIDCHTLLAGFCLGITTVLFVIANKITTAANAIMLQSVSPIFVLIFNAARTKTRPLTSDLWAVSMVLFGVFLFFLSDLAFGNILGNLSALLSGVLFAGAYVCTADASNLHAAMSGVLLGHLLSAVIGLPFLLMTPILFTPSSVVAILFLGIFQLGISYVLFSYAVQTCGSLAVSLLSMLEPICSPIWVALFVGEIPGSLALLGGMLVLITLFLRYIAMAYATQNNSLS